MHVAQVVLERAAEFKDHLLFEVSSQPYMDPIALKYTGKPFPFRSPEGRVAPVIEIEKAQHTKLPFEHTPPK